MHNRGKVRAKHAPYVNSELGVYSLWINAN